MEIRITETKTVWVTPQMMAKIFWQMTSDAQTEFFAALADEVGNIDDLRCQMTYAGGGASQEVLDVMIAIGDGAK